jgi:hypothetical protein
MYTITYAKPGVPGHLVTDSREVAMDAARADVESREWWHAGCRVIGMESRDGVTHWFDSTYRAGDVDD